VLSPFLFLLKISLLESFIWSRESEEENFFLCEKRSKESFSANIPVGRSLAILQNKFQSITFNSPIFHKDISVCDIRCISKKELRYSYHTHLITFGFAARTHTLVAIYIYIAVRFSLFFCPCDDFVKNFWHGLPIGNTTGLRNYYGILNKSTNASRECFIMRSISTGNKFILNLSEYCIVLFSTSFHLLKIQMTRYHSRRSVAFDEFEIVVFLYLNVSCTSFRLFVP